MIANALALWKGVEMILDDERMALMTVHEFHDLFDAQFVLDITKDTH